MGNCTCCERQSDDEVNAFQKLPDELASIDVNQFPAFIKFIDDGLSKIKGLPQEMERMTVEVVKQAGQSHWVLLGLLMVASALERMEKASSNESDCIELLERMTDLAKIVQRLNNTIPEEADILNKAVQVIVEGATVCCNYISKGKDFQVGFSKPFYLQNNLPVSL
eukprot:Gb_33405 [translate_table: standard]